MTTGDKENDDRRIAQIMEIAESLASDDVQDGYSKVGPVSSDAFRFKWTARELDDGRFVVDETIGGGSVAVSSRPMSREAVQPYIDERQRLIQAKIEDTMRELLKIQEPFELLPQTAPPASDGPDPLQMFDEIQRMLRETK